MGRCRLRRESAKSPGRTETVRDALRERAVSTRWPGSRDATEQRADLGHLCEQRVAEKRERGHRPLRRLRVAAAAGVAYNDGDEPEVGAVSNRRLDADFGGHAD